MINKSECFAYVSHGNHAKCSILSATDCYKCSFFKTKQQYQEELVKYPPDISKFVLKNK